MTTTKRTSGWRILAQRSKAAAAAALAVSVLGAGALAQESQEAKEPVVVKMTTSLGEITIELNREKAPISVANFLKYVDEGFYEGTIFHRVIGNFMIQGGGFDENLQQKRPPHPPIKNEWRNGLKNVRGAIAMARTQIADSATSQFFINVTDNGFLDEPRDGAAYAVFGKVIEGMDVVDKIRALETRTVGRMADVPATPPVILKVERITEREQQAQGHDNGG